MDFFSSSKYIFELLGLLQNTTIGLNFNNKKKVSAKGQGPPHQLEEGQCRMLYLVAFNQGCFNPQKAPQKLWLTLFLVVWTTYVGAVYRQNLSICDPPTLHGCILGHSFLCLTWSQRGPASRTPLPAAGSPQSEPASPPLSSGSRGR